MTCQACGTAMPPGFAQCFGCGTAMATAPAPAPRPAPAPDLSGPGSAPALPQPDNFFGTTTLAPPVAPAGPPPGAPRGWAPPAPPGAFGSGPGQAAPGRARATGPGSAGGKTGVIALVAVLVLAVVGGAVYFVVNLGKGAGDTVSAAGALLDSGPKGALERQLQSDVANGASAEETYNGSSGGYTASVPALVDNGLRVAPGDRFRVVSATDAQFCLASSRPGVPTAYWSSATGGISPSPCH